MLTELHIKQFALIEELRLELGPGFTAITGETGAGKSITIDALSAAAGDRVASDSVRTGADQAIVEATFDASAAPRALQAAAEAGIEPDPDGALILTRIISASGRNRCRVNGRSVPLGALRAIGDRLVDIHGQHEHQALIREENHLRFLDAFGGDDIASLQARYAEAFSAFREARAARDALAAAARDRLQELDLLRFQLQELDAAGLSADEEDELLATRRRLANAERLREGALTVRDLLSGGAEDGLAAVDAVREALTQLLELAKLDTGLEGAATSLETTAYQLEDLAGRVDDYLEAIDADPAALDDIEDRLALISRLKRKYGDSVADILEYAETARRKLSDLENADDRLAELNEELAELAQAAGGHALKLSGTRAKAAKALAESLTADLADVGMPEGRLEAELTRASDERGLPDGRGGVWAANETGIDLCRFLFSANPGEPLKPLSAIASGGEMSRVMLLLKSLCTRGHEIQTVVFDEVDAGIGGRATHAVGAKLAELSGRTQVLCVTHLPQIARLADGHFHADKQTAAGRTHVSVGRLDDEERVAEIARMLGAREGDKAVLEHAEELLGDAARAGKAGGQ